MKLFDQFRAKAIVIDHTYINFASYFLDFFFFLALDWGGFAIIADTSSASFVYVFFIPALLVFPAAVCNASFSPLTSADAAADECDFA